MIAIFTIGYERASPEALIAALAAAGVELLVDVRAVAASRRKGFSKTALRQRLESEGLGYLHLRALGDPKLGREAARRGDWTAFERIYSAQLDRADAIAEHRRLADLARAARVCLLCYEADPARCHRTIVADRIGLATGASVRHLAVTRPSIPSPS